MALSRPTFKVPAHCPESGLQCVVTLAKLMKTAEARAQLIQMAHTLIRNSETMEELGYTTTTPRELTMSVKALDEGVYAHLLNKVAKLIRSKSVTAFDPLSILEHHWLCDEAWPMDSEGNPLLDGALYWASKNYAFALLYE